MHEGLDVNDKTKLLKELNTSMNGLTTIEAKSRLKKYGLNELPKENKKPIYKIFLANLNDPIIYILIISAILSLVVNELIDSIAIVIIILIDAIVSTIQEYNANKNSEALKNLIKDVVRVIRDNKYFEIDSRYLVPGDVVVIEPGIKISADIRLLKSNNITADESILTGESVGVNKSENSTKININDNSILVYGGTSILTGYGLGVVVNTGMKTEVGKIAKKIVDIEQSKAPLVIRMEKFSKEISFIIIFVALLVGFILFIKGNEVFDIFLSVVALCVSAMPEGLPLALTMALTIGSNRMGKRNVIVKKLNSVESLGSCTVIASDKTGTLTVNEQTAKKIVLADKEEFDITENGYNIDGKVNPINDSNILNAQYIAKLGYINNESVFEKESNKWKHLGDSIDIAFKVLAHKAKATKFKYSEIYKIPYESEKKYSALFYEEGNKIKCTAKGSVEKILTFCSYSLIKGKKELIDKKQILQENERLASLGYRVIAVCDSTINKDGEYSEKNIKDLTFIGLVGFIDPVRKEAIQSVKKCRVAGIKIIMITGDHALTAYAIAKELSIVDKYAEVITGADLESFEDDDERFDEYIKNVKVFARVSPIQKLKIVNSLQRQGEFVAVTGDGVNDVPALKAANIGVAMGTGSDVAKSTANMIIIDNNFASIVSGIEEGRNAYSNIRKISIMLLSCGLAEVLFFVFAIMFNLPIPLVAIQLLWLNLVTDGFQDMALSFERETDTIMKEKPRSTKESLFEKELITQIILSGTFMGIIVFIVWVVLIKVLNMDVFVARGYVLALMVFMQNVHVLNCRSETKSIFNNSFMKNKFVIFTILITVILQIIVMEVSTLSNFLQTTSIPIEHLIILILLALPIMIVMELYKYVKAYKKERKNMI